MGIDPRLFVRGIAMWYLLRCSGVFGILAFVLTLNTQAALVDFARLDFGVTAQRVEAGWTGIGTGLSDNSTNNTNLPANAVTSLTGANFTVALNNQNAAGTGSGGLDWRDRGDTTSTQALTRVGEDFVKNNSGFITVVLSGLPVGNYQITGYHLDADNDQADNIQMSIKVGSGSFLPHADTGNANFTTGGVNALTEARVLATTSVGSFTQVNPGDVVTLLFNGTASTQAPVDIETPLNGLMIQFEAVAVPEPTTCAALASMLLLGYSIRRRVKS
jgi:hypothetical protein